MKANTIKFPKHFAHTRAKRSSALIIVLATLVLISSILLLFFNQSTLNRQISFSSAGQYRADVLAHTAMNTIAGDLRSEIVAGSSITTTASGSNIYIPVTNFTMVPCRVADQGFANLVAQSASSSTFWSGKYYTSTIASPVRSAANNSTLTASSNGRYISANRWNKPGLLGDPGSGTTPLAPSGSYTPPDWVVVTRQGPITNAGVSMPSVATLADKTYSNQNFAVGRYAYTIYNEGALLDANVVGYPNNSSQNNNSLSGTAFATERGLLPQVDLANLLTQAPINDGNGAADASALVNWRNQATATSAGSYTNYVFSATNGFTAVGSTNGATDQAFIGRQDLINYVKNNSSIPTTALPYLGTFTRDSDSPSVYPNPSRPASPAGLTSDNITNPNVLTIRVQKSFTRGSDGTTAAVGEPLLKHRFPLSLLALFGNPGGSTKINGVTQFNTYWIQKYFCMQQGTSGNGDAGIWDYVDPDTGTLATTVPAIKTLAQVAATTNREPDFWELLQAGILAGSLGANQTSIVIVTSPDAITMRHLFAIGLNIIDQYTTATSPFVLNFGGETPTSANNLFIAGEENLPYISAIFQQHFLDNQTILTPSTNTLLDGYLMFSLWNPHRNVSSAVPGNFRIRVNGKSYIFAYNTNNMPGAVYEKYSPPILHTDTLLTFQTTSSRNFNQIDGLRPTDATVGSSTLAHFPYPPYPPVNPLTLQVGILMGQMVVPKIPAFQFYGMHDNSLANYYPIPLVITLEMQVGANWIPYQSLYGFNFSESNNAAYFPNISNYMNTVIGFGAHAVPTLTNPSSPAAYVAFLHSDPRTSRFGLAYDPNSTIAMAGTPNSSFFLNLINVSSTGYTYSQPNVTLSNPADWPVPPTYGTSSLNFPKIVAADYAYNVSSLGANHFYSDPDGVVRKGDSNPNSSELSGTHGVDSPFTYGDARPVMLNRPFTSVAEMGYAYRDDPWRSLDFSSMYSADGGLLDLFCLTPNNNSVRAGVLDPNGASQPVLSSVFMNNYQDPANPTGTVLSSSQASTIAQAIRTQLGTVDSPTLVLKNAADLPTLVSQISSSVATPTFLPNKYQREVVTRSLTDIMNTRTWNLMIDVIAQSGRYTTASKTLNDFVVEGERRYWVHVAIDRFTGEVIDSQVEPVSE